MSKLVLFLVTYICLDFLHYLFRPIPIIDLGLEPSVMRVLYPK